MEIRAFRFGIIFPVLLTLINDQSLFYVLAEKLRNFRVFVKKDTFGDPALYDASIVFRSALTRREETLKLGPVGRFDNSQKWPWAVEVFELQWGIDKEQRKLWEELWKYIAQLSAENEGDAKGYMRYYYREKYGHFLSVDQIPAIKLRFEKRTDGKVYEVDGKKRHKKGGYIFIGSLETQATTVTAYVKRRYLELVQRGDGEESASILSSQGISSRFSSLGRSFRI